MYNLVHLYFYEDLNNDNIEKSIELLIKSICLGFDQSRILLSLILVKKNMEMMSMQLKKK